MMESTIAQCQYIGGQNSDHFHNNQFYTIQIVQGLFGRIKVAPVRGYYNEPMHGISETYRNLHEFLHNWLINEVVHGNLFNGREGQPMA